MEKLAIRNRKNLAIKTRPTVYLHMKQKSTEYLKRVDEVYEHRAINGRVSEETGRLARLDESFWYNIGNKTPEGGAFLNDNYN